MLKDEISDDSQSVKRFIYESRAVAMLSHPNIVSIYDVSVKDNLKYIVMERIDGITLKSYMTQKGALSVKETISFTEQILRALEHAHSKGIIHRDIKPQNILLLKNGQIKVTDFGIAKLPNTETLTKDDKAIGTVFYISPEQAGGKKIDQRSDIYSLGVLMYEMITGKLPFYAESPVTVALMQVNDAPKNPKSVSPEVPEGIDELIMMCLKKDPADRFQSASQMLKYLNMVKADPSKTFIAAIVPNSNAKAGKTNKGGKSAVKNMGKPDKKKKQKKQSRSMLPIILGVFSAFIVVFAASLFIIYVKDFAPNKVDKEVEKLTVPDLITQEYNETLVNMLKSRGFKVTCNYVVDAEVTPNTIIDQVPAAGEIRNNPCDLSLTVSKAEQTIVLPDCTAKDYIEVKLQLHSLGLIVKEEFQYNSNLITNYVIKTEPSAGNTLAVGDTVTLFVSKGSKNTKTVVPNLVGMTEQQVKEQLESSELKLGSVTYEQNSKAEGIVIDQSIEVEKQVPSGTEINIVVSSGPDGTSSTDKKTKDEDSDEDEEDEKDTKDNDKDDKSDDED